MTMEAVLSDKECGYYMKLITFILGIGMDVLHTYFEQNILNAKEHLEFYMFLDKNKHNLYHECYPKIECCECSKNGLGMASQKGCLTKQQFMLLFEIGTLTEIDHFQRGRRFNEITKQCLCRIIAKRSNDVDCMDITLMYAIIQSCYLKHNIAIHGNPRCIEAIKDTRNFLAHVPNPRISKSEFDTRFTETEQAILEIGSSLGKYFTKVNQKNIEEFKRNDLSIEGIKEIIENNIDEIIKKKLQTFIEDQRTNAVIIKDEISEQLAKYKDEMVIEIRNLIFEVRQDAVASCSIEKTLDSSVPQKIDTACSVNVEETEDSKNVTKRRVEWKLVTPSTWNLPGIKDTLKKCSAQLRQWFEIENVFVGSLVIQTLVQQSVLDNREEFRASVHLFLKKFVEVCRINADVPTVVKVALIIEIDEFEKEETEEQPSNIEMNKIEKTPCIADNTSFDCQNCRQKDEIIASLKEELSEHKKGSSAVLLESVVSEIEKDPPKIKPESVAVQQDIGDDLRANKAQVATGHVLSTTANYTRLIIAVKHITENMLKELLEHVIQPEKLIAEFENEENEEMINSPLKFGDLVKIHYAEKGYLNFDYNLICRILLYLFPDSHSMRLWERPFGSLHQPFASMQQEMLQGFNIDLLHHNHNSEEPIDPRTYERSLGYIIDRCQRLCNVIIDRPNTMISSQEFNAFLNNFISIAKGFEIILKKQPNEFVCQFEDLRSSRY